MMDSQIGVKRSLEEDQLCHEPLSPAKYIKKEEEAQLFDGLRDCFKKASDVPDESIFLGKLEGQAGKVEPKTEPGEAWPSPAVESLCAPVHLELYSCLDLT